MQACGMSDSDAENTIGEWEFEAEWMSERGRADRAGGLGARTKCGQYRHERVDVYQEGGQDPTKASAEVRFDTI